MFDNIDSSKVCLILPVIVVFVLTGHWSRCPRRRYQSYQARSLTSPQNLQQHNPRTPGLKNRDINQPQPGTDIGRSETLPRRIQPQAKIKMCTPEADIGSPITGTNPPEDTRWRSLTRLRRVASQVMVTTSQLRKYIKGGKTCNKELINGGPTEWGGEGLNEDIVHMNENYMNYIRSNPKLVQPMDNLSVADSITTGHYLTLDSPCNNKQQAVHMLPIQMLNGEIIMSMHTVLLYQPDLPLQVKPP